jgi:hypothetical protein
MDALRDRLGGHRLSAVIFVMDYVQFDFDGQRFSPYVWPDVEIDDELPSLGQSGYRDSLCSFITHGVESVEEAPGSGVVIEFDTGAIRLSPREADLTGPEIALFNAARPDPFWLVWRPGEGVFQSLS